jgi:hypothetical protein
MPATVPLTLQTGAAFTTTTVIDRSEPGLIRLQIQLTQFVLDTEVGGVAAGQVSLNTAVTHSMDGTTYSAVTPTSTFGSFDGFTLGPQLDGLYLVGRFVKVVCSVWRNSALYASGRQPRIVADVKATLLPTV